MKPVKKNVVPVRFSDAQMIAIDEAAALIGENRSEFVREAAKARAIEIASVVLSKGLKKLRDD